MDQKTVKTIIAKAVVAGLVAGIFATGVKTVWEMGFPVRDKSTPSPPVVLADRALEAAGQGGLSEQHNPWPKASSIGPSAS